MKYTNKQLLKEAYRRFPIGTRFLSNIADKNLEREVRPYEDDDDAMEYVILDEGEERKVYVTGGMSTLEGGCSNPYLYQENVGWCPIIEEQINYEIY